MQEGGCGICVLWFSFMLVLRCLRGGWLIKEMRFVLRKVALSLLESVLESQTGEIQGRSLQGGVFMVESSVRSWQWSCGSQLSAPAELEKTDVKAVSAAEFACLMLHSSGPGAEK